MSIDDISQIGAGKVKRKVKRRVGLFIDSSGLDRASKRLERKVDIGRLVQGLSTGLKIEVARYYCLIPYEDDARQFSFLDAISRSGLEVVTKRLPPKTVNRLVSMDVHVATDLITFAYGGFEKKEEGASPLEVKRAAVIVCPSRELSYSIYLASTLGVETSLADFGLYGSGDGWPGVDRWIDLSTSETIWRD